MAAAISVGTTRDAGAIDLSGCRLRRIPVTGVSDGDTLTTVLPSGIVQVAWAPGSTGEECNAVHDSGTVTFYTDGVTSYDGDLFVWSKS